MNSLNNLYLRDDIYFEPLFNHWYVWPYLLPPVTAARHIVNTHKRIMTSFVNNYDLHIMAVQEKGMAGSDFLNCQEEQVPQIKLLIDEIDEKCADLVALSESVKEIDQLLLGHTTGESIEPLYSKVPEILKGYVELCLDLEHRPSYRLIEPLIYKSPLYKPFLQSVSFGMLSKVKERPFVLSTPRLPDQNHLHMDVNFNHEILDRIFLSREEPMNGYELDALLKNVKKDGGLGVKELFTNERSKYQYAAVKEGVRLTYTGHAGFLVETAELTIMIDPVIASRGSTNAEDVISFSQLPPKIDYICLTHTHQDHVNIETLLQLRHKTGNVFVPKNNSGSLADPSLRLLLKQLNFNVSEVDDLDEILVPSGRIVAIPFLGEHGDLNIRSKTAWYIELKGRKMFFGADSANLENKLYEKLGSLFSDMDILAIGMECIGAPYTWIYGALHTTMVKKNIKDSRRLNGADCEQAMLLVKAFNAKQVFIYALGMEPWYKYFMGVDYDDDSKQIVESNQLIEACQEIGIKAERLYGKKIVEL